MNRVPPDLLLVRRFALGGLLLMGCSSDSSQADRLATLLGTPEQHLADVGAPRDGDLSRELGIIVAARVTATGEHVVVLDAVPPFVKVFRRDGSLRASFGARGEGPGEIKAPTAIATLGDSTIVVADISSRILVFGIGGDLLEERVSLPFRTMAAADLCDTGWLLYGPRFSETSGAPEWLHTVSFAPGTGLGEPRSAFSDTLRQDAILGFGKPYGMVAAEQAVFVRHDFPSPAVILELDCASGAIRTRALPTVDPGPRPVESKGTSGHGFQILPGTRVPAGLAVISGHILVADVIQLGETDADTETEFRVLDDAGSPPITLPGIWVLRDSRPGVGVLIETQDPIPHVMLLSEADLLAALGR